MARLTLQAQLMHKPLACLSAQLASTDPEVVLLVPLETTVPETIFKRRVQTDLQIQATLRAGALAQVPPITAIGL